MKLKSDTTFQAAKKKTPQERKKNTEMYALNKPQRALQAMFAMCWTTTSATSLDNNLNTTFTYTDLYPGFLNMLLTLILAVVIGIMVMGGWRHWRVRALPGQAAEAEHPEGASRPAVSSVEVQTELEMHELVPFQEYFDEISRLEHIMDNEMIPLNEHHAAEQRHERELDTYYEALCNRLQAQEQQHRANLHNLTQAPVFFTKNGRCWHADPECLRRFATQEIYEKNYCTRCSHTLGRILEPDVEPSTAAASE